MKHERGYQCREVISRLIGAKRHELTGGYNYDQLRFDRRSTLIRLQFDRTTTIRRPTLRPLWTVALQLEQAVREAVTICPRPLQVDL